jgi:hypothetical protein
MNAFYKLAFTLLFSILLCGCNASKTHVDHSETIAILQATHVGCRREAGQVLNVSAASNKWRRAHGIDTEPYYRATMARYEGDIANCERVFSNDLAVEMAK